MSFVHLHTHSEYSLLDGLGKTKKLAARAKELGMPALALTDHGAMFGAIEFYNACLAEGVKPIIGIEAYMAARSMADRDSQLDRRSFHLLLLAENETGYRNLLQIATKAQLDGFYYFPRIDHEALAQHAKGLICTTGCLSSEISRALVDGRDDEARRLLNWHYDVFGKDNFFFELQDHDVPELRQLNKKLLDIAPHYDANFVATNDVHYVMPDDHMLQDVMLCVQTGSLVTDKDRMRMSDASYYLRPANEMEALFGHVPGALSNTLRIAERCTVDLGFKGYRLPEFPVPAGHTPPTYLRLLCEDGLRRRYGRRADEDPTLRERLDYELDVIHKMGFDTYFLIVWDLCQHAASRGIWYNARGSAAGSIVAYSLEITLVEPIEHDLIFERFLNPSRITMPDIDLDFQDDRRHEMLEYTSRKYGADKVAQIITFGTLGARAAIRDVGRVLNVDLNQKVDPVAKTIPNISGKGITISAALEEVPEFRSKYEEDDEVRQMIDIARKLEGVARNAGTHAAGVVITDKPITEYVPLHRPTKGTGDDSPIGAVTQFEMEILDSLGLLKVDFLGLRTLTIMARACEFIKQRHGKSYNINNIPTDDPAIYDLLSRGEVAGVFQVEGSGMRRFLVEMRPTRLAHLIAMISLYRPGPLEFIPSYIRRMHGQEPVEYRHPMLESILAETYGITVYQEQIMRALMRLAGYSAAEADGFRKVVAKKKSDDMAKHRQKFIAGAVANGIPEPTASQIFEDWETFARYGFNKSHAADYAIICAQTAYLKARYPVEFMTALLTAEKGDTDKIAAYTSDARRMGINILPPDVNSSGLDFTIEDLPDHRSAIRFGLGAIKNVGEAPVAEIVRARLPAHGGAFRSLEDFCERVDLRIVGKRALECLIKVGALGSLGKREQLIAALDIIVSLSASAHKAREVGQLDLFGGIGGAAAVSKVALPANVPDLPLKDLRSWEKELMGLYVSDHPLLAVLDDIQELISHHSNELNEDVHGRSVTAAGQVTHIRHHITASSNKQMAFATLEDLQGSIDLVIFPKSWREVSQWLEVDQVVLVTGKVDAKGNDAKILVDNITRDLRLTKAARQAPAPDDTKQAPRIAHSSPRVVPSNWPDDFDPFAGDVFDPTGEWDEDEDDSPPTPPVAAPSTTSAPDAGSDGQTSAANGKGGGHSPNNGGSPHNGSAALPPSQHDMVWEERPSLKRPAPVPQLAADAHPALPADSSTLPDDKPKRIVVTLNPTGSGDHDKRRLRRVYETFLSHPGHDTFALVVFEADGTRFELDFRNDTTHFCEELKQQLSRFVGSEWIEVVGSN